MKWTNPNPRLKKMAVVLKGLLAGLFTLTLAALVSGCASDQSRRVTATPKSGVVCPQCRTVTLGPFPSSAEWRGGPPATVQRHECTGCRGILSIYGEGDQFRREWSVCKQTPFSCTVNSR
jgi:hypothetical protein